MRLLNNSSGRAGCNIEMNRDFVNRNYNKFGKEFDSQEVRMILVGIGIILLMLIRCFYGIDFTDESFPVSDTLAIMHGNIPFAYDTLLYVGQCLIPMLFYRLYEVFVPDLSGIMLYSRLCYLIFRLVVIFSVTIFLKKDIGRKKALLLGITLLPYMGGFLPNFSYNTIPTYLSMLTGVILYYSLKEDKDNKRKNGIFAAGVFTALSVFAHPVYGITLIVFILLVLIYSKKEKRLVNLLLYCLGGIIVVLLVLLPVVIKVGMSKLIYGITTMLFYGQDMDSTTTAVKIIGTIKYMRIFLIPMFLMAIVTYLLSATAIGKKHTFADKSSRWMFSTGIAIILGLYICLTGHETKIIAHLYGIGVVAIVSFAFLLPIVLKDRQLVFFIALYTVGFVAFMVSFSLSNRDRFLYAIPLMTFIIYVYINSSDTLVKSSGIIISAIIISLQLFIDMGFVYRDYPVHNLTTKVKSGVYKGIYTTNRRAEDIEGLEKYLNSNISPDELIAFRDNAPEAHLMINRNVCNPKTWDEMQWEYKCNDPTSMYRYYKNREAIPDVIIYVDMGRDKSLSIENSSEVFQYNDFVNQYYYLDCDDFHNDTFRVLIYRNNGTFDGDYDRLIESVRVTS